MADESADESAEVVGAADSDPDDEVAGPDDGDASVVCGATGSDDFPDPAASGAVEGPPEDPPEPVDPVGWGALVANSVVGATGAR